MAFSVHINMESCTGCGNCIDVCPAKVKALEFRPLADAVEKEEDNWNYFAALPEKDLELNASTVKGSQFEPGAGFYFTETPAWGAKALLSAHGTWAELRHDTILYVKQVYGAEMSGGGDWEPTWRVEPIPEADK